ncbi:MULTISPECIES: helix-turn-helix domain-containing protein [Paenibacillus]|uniref:helix-turn-helix domain-containing protein n=1 Tax=Paenibacillus TaxID=44249 RepID=UPI00201D847D|nr:helix-turn-helix domain-containing protein [Paenibacillus amylolyticus]MCL6663416.1 helix-turn-helix domain-containing protein [Paenibacillus amylolyticus]
MMTHKGLYHLVQLAKSGDKEAMGIIIKRFEPSIKKACRNVSINEQHDLQQYLNEKIIRAVLHYDMSSIPDFNQFVESVSNDSYNSC